jgi:drug/metabolite transporter (DMT)-like permease
MSALQMAVIAPVVAGAPPSIGSLSGSVLWSMLALGALGSGVAFVLSYHVISVAGVTTGSMVTYVVPVVAAVLGVAALGEHLTWNQPVGGLVVLVGVALAQGLIGPRGNLRER